MPIESLSSFLAELEKYPLLSAEQMQATRQLGDTGWDGHQLAAELIRRDWLTPFQANQLLQSNGRTLVLGPYLLLERLGQGGMGQVYKARHTLMERLVALKVLRADLMEQPGLRDRFRREIQAAAKLTHRNVVLAHDANQIGDTFFLVMEYVAGIDLARLLAQHGRLPPGEAANYAQQAALGLQHAHEHGLVHRDIKPSNLIRANAGGVVKILDLGLARLRAEMEGKASRLTHEGAIMGTPDYMAPEQAQDPAHADIRADIYSLGSTLYHLLTGRVPFPGGSLTQKLLKLQQDEPTPIERLCPDVPPSLATIVRTMMAKRPEDRYPTPAAVADVLAPFAHTTDKISDGHAIPLQEVASTNQAGVSTVDFFPLTNPNDPVVTTKRKQSPTISRRGKFLIAGLLAGLLFLLAVPVLVIAFFLLGGSRVTRDDSPTAQPSVVEEQKPIGEAVPHDKPNARLDDNSPLARPVGEPEHLAPRADAVPRLLHELNGHTGKVRCLAFSPDGRWLASGSDDNTAVLWDVKSGEQQGVALTHKHPVRALVWSADGKRLASGSWGGAFDAAIKLWEPSHPERAQTRTWEDKTGTPMKADVRALAFSADGKFLASGGGPLRLWNLTKDEEPNVRDWQQTLPSYLYGVAFSPDNKLVAVGCHEQGDSVLVWDTNNAGDPIVLRGKEQAFGLSHSDVAAVVAFTGGGKLLVRVTSDGLGFGKKTASVRVWQVDSARRKFQLRDTYPIPGGAVFALTGAADGHLRAAIADGPPTLPGRTEPNAVKTASEVRLWEDGVTTKVASFDTKHKQSITALALSPDGRLLATGSEDQSVKLWELSR